MTVDLLDIKFILQWWLVLFLIGVISLPLTARIFSNFFDRGYIFSKIIGALLISYSVFLLGSLKILPFTETSIILVFGAFLVLNIFLIRRLANLKNNLKIFVFEEIIFLVALVFWAFIRAHEPSIHGLEKYMDFGFVNSILRTDYFPPKDMWYTPSPINYYYFGHLVTAVLTKFSGINSTITYNLMVATLFALTFTGVFSIGVNLVSKFHPPTGRIKFQILLGGLLTAILVTFTGNLHTIYTLFQPYIPANSPVPFWQLPFSPESFPNSYWYPNATRFIPFTIHEFPIYSFVVSDLHGHVLDIPFILSTVAFLLSILISKSLNILKVLFLSLLIAVMYMTNAWDGLIYAGLTLIIFIFLGYKSKNYKLYAICYTLIIIGSIILALPFSLHFKPFVSGIGIVKDHSPLYMLAILWGFFYFFVVSFIVFILRKKIHPIDIFILFLVLFSTILIMIPEFFYAKDIYPAHYRANTMFKLGYEAFIMLGIATGYIITRIILGIKYYVLRISITGLLLLVFIYPYFAINSYYGELKNYQGLNGLSYLNNLYPTDYQAIIWIRENIEGQPVILEANGDSYTDFARVSANTGLPTVVGWPVHEWLWRGSYNVAAPRITDIQTLYETPDIKVTKELIKKYHISLVFVGDLERQKYQSIYEDKFKEFGKIIFEKNQTRIYLIGQLADSI